MENNIITIHGITCYEKDGVAYLNLEAVARGLGFTQKKNGIEYVRWETVNKMLDKIGFPNKLGKDSFIPENIFYRLAMKAKNDTAERFQTLIADEVIPAIRKTGGYVANPDTFVNTYLPFADEATKSLFRATLSVIEQQNHRIQQDAPKVLFADSVASSHTEILVGELAKILKQNGVVVGQNRLFERMRRDGYLISRKGTDYNMPTQKSMQLGLMRIKETSVTHSDGHVTVSKTPKVTGKGQVYFVNKYAIGNK